MYNQKIIEVFNNPSYVGILHGHNAQGTATSEVTGEIVRIYLLIENDKIKEAKFKAFGGVSCIALSSLACEIVLNKNINDIEKISKQDFVKKIGELPENGALVINQIKQALEFAVIDYHKKLEKEKNK